jgi:hypothetical protein
MPLGRIINAGQGAFVLSGKSSLFPVALSLKAAFGSYAITGNGAALVYTPASGGAVVSHSSPFFATPGRMTSLP